MSHPSPGPLPQAKPNGGCYSSCETRRSLSVRGFLCSPGNLALGYPRSGRNRMSPEEAKRGASLAIASSLCL